MNRRARLVGALLAFAISACGARARAEPAAGDRAVELGRKGLELLETKSFQDAYERFEQAESLSHSPVFILYMARAKRKSGALLLARELYARVVAESLPPAAPDSWVQAQVEARTELASVSEEIPSLIVSVPGVVPNEVEVTVDGATVVPGVVTPLDPGQHTVHASIRGRTSVERRVDLPARSGSVELVLELASKAPSIVPKRAHSKPASSAVHPSPSWPTVTLLGVGAAGMGVGVTTGLIALFKTKALKDECGGNACEPKQRPQGRAADDFATVSNWSFAVGGLGLAAGAALLVFKTAAAPVQIATGPDRVVLFGSF